jgi:hypothetical protein
MEKQEIRKTFWLVKLKRKVYLKTNRSIGFNPLNAELNPICHLLALLGAHPTLHVSGVRDNIEMYLRYGLLYNGYRVFPGGKERPGRDADPSHPSSAVVMNE